MTIMLTGANGFVGRTYLASLSPFGEPVVAVDVAPPKKQPHVSLPVVHKVTDLTNRDAVISLIKEVMPSSIIHLAAISKVGDQTAIKINCSMANNLFHTVADLYTNTTPPKMILAGSAAEYGDIHSDEVPPDEYTRLNPLDPYAESKVIISRVAHTYRRDFDIPITILRFANIYGPRQEEGKLVPNLVKAAVRGHPIILNANGTPTRQWLYVDDAILAIDTALNHINSHPSAIYNIGGQNEVSLRDLAMMIIQATQDVMLNLGLMFEPSIIDCRAAFGGSQRVAMDMSLAKRVLAFQPRISLSHGLHRTVGAYLEDHNEIREIAYS